MKRMVRIAGPFPIPNNQSVRDAFVDFCRDHGLEFTPPGGSYVELEETDSRLHALLALLASRGLTPRPPHVSAYMSDLERARYVSHEVRHVYEPTDWDVAEYLLLIPQHHTTWGTHDDSLRRNAHAELEFHPDSIPAWMHEADVGKSDSDGLDCIVSDRARRTLEGVNVSHMRFGPVHFVPFYVEGRGVIEHRGSAAPTWWELDSDLMLPPVSDVVPLVDARGQRVLSNLPTDRHWRHPQPEDGMWRYRRAALAAVGPFDIARTLEPWGPHTYPYGRKNNLLVSPKFYRVCRDHGIDCYWVPVKVVDA